MPPPKSRKVLSAAEIDLIERWIAEGADYEGHWAFTRPERPNLPAVSDGRWTRNPIDRFILARLDAANLKPNPEAERRTLIRRISFDLTGLPPTPAEVDAFLNDPAPVDIAYANLVETLFRSPAYGEHRARYWLDAARYGDTHGLHLDNYREIWPYRDWVINAFNENMPFDQFTIEQLAGDLLPDPTLDQRIATGFVRCNVTTSEGGAIDDEYNAIYAKDRVATTTRVWMGLSADCASCHDHKFDPDHDAGLLPAHGLLPEHDPEGHGWQRQGHAAQRLRSGACGSGTLGDARAGEKVPRGAIGQPRSERHARLRSVAERRGSPEAGPSRRPGHPRPRQRRSRQKPEGCGGTVLPDRRPREVDRRFFREGHPVYQHVLCRAWRPWRCGTRPGIFLRRVASHSGRSEWRRDRAHGSRRRPSWLGSLAAE